MKPTLALLFGGCSNEYEVSLHSAAAVLRAINRNRYNILTVGITRSGQWLACNCTPQEMEADTWAARQDCVPAAISPSREDQGIWLFFEAGAQLRHLDIVFPVLHGLNGEDGTLQGLLELAGLPFVGSGCLSSALTMDKQIAHDLARQAGIACPRFATLLGTRADLPQMLKTLEEEMALVPFPWFVKPAREGSSFGVTRVERADELEAALANALRYGCKVVVEEGITGFEVGCAVLGNESPVTGAVDAISLAGGFFDFHEKYTLETAKILLPAPVDEATARRITETALRLYRLFECEDYARVDLFLNEQGEIIFNEVNPIPGMTPHSRFPGMLRHAGIGFEEMVERLIGGVLQP